MELQHFRLAPERGGTLDEVLTLMEMQTAYINQIYKVIYLLFLELDVISSADFKAFTSHFNIFVQRQSCSEGFGKAIEAVQIYDYGLFEKLFDGQVLAAAEQLELAIGYFENIIRSCKIREHPQLFLLNQGLLLLEDTQLRIIENLETLLNNSRQVNLQN